MLDGERQFMWTGRSSRARNYVMKMRISPGIFCVGVLVAALICGIPLYRQATEPLYNGGPPESPAESNGRVALTYLRPGLAMATGVTSNPPFVDVATAAGLRYEWAIPGKRPLNILQTIGDGCAFLDYDNDGNLDILLVGPKLALYRGDGRGHFVDATGATGLDRLSGHFLGCAVGDYDGDGYDDIYISGYRTGLLLHNEAESRVDSNGTPVPLVTPGLDESRPHSRLTPASRVFRDVTREAGLAPQPWGTSCVFLETIPGSGRLDLYVCNYVEFSADTQQQLCVEAKVLTACPPTIYRPLKGVLYLNDGNGHFRDSTQTGGAAAVSGKGLGVTAADYDGSGRPSLAIANDEMPGDLLHPIPSTGRVSSYKNLGPQSGTAYDRDGNLRGGMGLGWGDYDNDGRLDLFVTAFRAQAKSVYHNDGSGRFSDRAGLTGIAAATLPYVAFGCKFLDYDNDGWLDLMIANGHVWSNAEEISRLSPYRQPTQLFHNTYPKNQAFEDVSKSSAALMRPIVGRGLAVGDYDNEGRIDALVVDAEGKPLLLHNQTRQAAHWLGVRLIGTTSNRDGYGATLTVRAGGRTLTRLCQTGGSYLSASDRRVHFGLGAAKRADALIVRWPSGRTETYRNPAIDRYTTIREGAASP